MPFLGFVSHRRRGRRWSLSSLPNGSIVTTSTPSDERTTPVAGVLRSGIRQRRSTTGTTPGFDTPSSSSLLSLGKNTTAINNNNNPETRPLLHDLGGGRPRGEIPIGQDTTGERVEGNLVEMGCDDDDVVVVAEDALSGAGGGGVTCGRPLGVV